MGGGEEEGRTRGEEGTDALVELPSCKWDGPIQCRTNLA